MTTDALAPCTAKASTAMALVLFVRTILVSTPEDWESFVGDKCIKTLFPSQTTAK